MFLTLTSCLSMVSELYFADKFNVRFVIEPQETFDAGIAIDDVGFVNCNHKPAEDECSEDFFHCKTSKVLYIYVCM